MLFALPRFFVFHFFVVVILSLLTTNALPVSLWFKFNQKAPTEVEVSKVGQYSQYAVEHKFANTDQVILKKKGFFGSKKYKAQLDNEANVYRVQERVYGNKKKGFRTKTGAPVDIEEGVTNVANREKHETGKLAVGKDLNGINKPIETSEERGQINLPKETLKTGEMNEKQNPTTNDETAFDFKTEMKKAIETGKTDFQTLIDLMEKSTTEFEPKDVNSFLHKIKPSVSWQDLNKLWNGLRSDTFLRESLDVNLLKKATDNLLSSNHISERDTECFINSHYYLHNQEQIDAVFNKDTLTRLTSKVTLDKTTFSDLVKYLESNRFKGTKSKELLEILFNKENIAKQLSPSRNDIDLYELRFILDHAPEVEEIKNLIYDKATLERAIKTSDPIYFNHFASSNKLDPEILKNVLLNPENVKKMFASQQQVAHFYYPEIVKLAVKAGNPNNILDLLLGNKPDLLNVASNRWLKEKMETARDLVRKSPRN